MNFGYCVPTLISMTLKSISNVVLRRVIMAEIYCLVDDVIYIYIMIIIIYTI